MIDLVGIAIGIDDGEYIYTQAPGFGDTDIFSANVDNEDGLGYLGHIPHAGEILFQTVQCIAEPNALFLGQHPEITLVSLLLKFEHVGNTSLDRLEVGHRATQPALVDVHHAAPFSFALNHLLRLALGANEEDFAALGHQINHLLVDIVNHAQGLLKVDDVDAVSLGEDVPFHRGVPAPGLMPEMDSRLEKGFHGEVLPHMGNGPGWFSDGYRRRGGYCNRGWCHRG